ncbi:MAG TPA: TrbG/VirB9 family P-type conjugative transfer protein, partial [Candidatus Eisenbacteria bacterium]|nr:TrbG/VirB9 family P-type conjugative transfer protein [Candidatus Eisenbacteria bacterium]
MNRTVSLILIYSFCAIAALSQQPVTPSPNAVVHVATALNHLTVLEFHEPVTMAAAGSSDFQIEREANKVFVKPIKSGAATDLFVWTASRRFAYELEITQEAKDMNFAIDTAQPAPAPDPKPVVATDTDQFADVVLTRALMGAEEIKQKSPRKAKGQVSVRVEQVFRTRNTVYVHY